MRDLEAELAAEEHRQGRPYLAEREHCRRCAEVDQAWVQAAMVERRAACEHEMVIESDLPQLDGHRYGYLRACADCGASLELVTEAILW